MYIKGQERASLVVQLPEPQAAEKNPPAMWETWVQSLGWEDPLEQGKAMDSRILAWRIPWIVQSMGLQRAGHNWATSHFHFQGQEMGYFVIFADKFKNQ